VERHGVADVHLRKFEVRSSNDEWLMVVWASAVHQPSANHPQIINLNQFAAGALRCAKNRTMGHMPSVKLKEQLANPSPGPFSNPDGEISGTMHMT
jgi:hypothetical protein